MPRGPRIDAPGCVHHVMVRGIERRLLFCDDVDRRDLLGRLSRILPESGMSCFAWALMPNHVHLVLRTGHVPLSQVMARVNTGYARAFNLRHDRIGHLFQNRYKAPLVASDAQLLALVRYVHLNPLRAGLVDCLDALARYPWTGHAALLGSASMPFQNTREILKCFGGKPAESRERLMGWMRSESEPTPDRSTAQRAEEPDASDPAVPEGGAGSDPERPADRDARSARYGSGFDARCRRRELVALVRQVASRRGISEWAILEGSRIRRASDARAEVVYRACTQLGCTGATLTRALGMSKGAVSSARIRGRALLESESSRPSGEEVNK